MRRALVVGFFLACSVAGSARQTPSRQVPIPLPGIAQVFETYESGRYAEAIEMLRPLGRARVLDKRLREEGPAWIAVSGPADRQHRAQVAAAVALEATRLVFADLGVSIPFRGSPSEGAFLGRTILEVGCEWLRQGPPTDFEHLWILASIAAVHSMQNFPTESPSASTMPDIDSDTHQRPEWYVVMRRIDNQHREHMTARYPNEPRVRLAAVLAEPEARRLSNRPGTTPFFVSTGFAADPGKGHPKEREDEAAKRIRQVIDRLTALVETPGIGAEARVRRGILFFHRADLAGALRDLRQAAADANDPVVAYMAHFYAGLTLDNLDQRSAAIDEFRAAVRTIPNARSGALALAADLFLVDQRDEAASLVEATLGAPAPNDPWRTFSLGDYRFWSGYVTRLRDAVRR